MFSLACLSGCALPGFTKPKKQPPAQAKPGPVTVALVVPSGKVASIVAAMSAGARLAASQQATAGKPVTVRVIPATGTWLADLAALPPASVVGGPFSDTSYDQMKAAGIMDKKVVFAFLPQLDGGDEGTIAWRFYPSLDDQIEAIVHLAADRLGVQGVASFGGTDSFAGTATALLEQKLASRNIILQRIAAEGDPLGWGELFKPYVNPVMDEATGTLRPQTPFEALFLPDSWNRVGNVNTALGSNGEERLYLFGTMLWDGYNARGVQNASRYALVAYPSGFVRDLAPASLVSSGAATFWGALGYDFVRFASRLNLSGRPDAAQVNRAARQAALMKFAMAPISYDGAGRASMKMYMVQPGEAGAKLADASAMQAARTAAVQRVEERALPPDQTPSLQPSGQGAGSAGPAGLPPAPSGPIMRSGPHSSYKLSLPGAPR